MASVRFREIKKSYDGLIFQCYLPSNQKMDQVALSSTCDVFICSSTKTGEILFFDVRENHYQILRRHKFKKINGGTRIVLSPSRRAEFFIPSVQNTVSCVNIHGKTVKTVKRLRLGESKKLLSLSYDATGAKFVLADESTVSVWKSSDFKVVSRVRFPPLETPVAGAKFSPKGSLVIIFDVFLLLVINPTSRKRKEKNVRLEVPQFVDRDRTPTGKILPWTVQVSMNDSTMVCATENGYVVVWNVSRRKILHVFELEVTKMQFFFDAGKSGVMEQSTRTIAALDRNGQMRIFDAVSGEVYHELSSGIVDILDFECKEKRLIVLYANSSIHFFDIDALGLHYAKLNMIENERMKALVPIKRFFSRRADIDVPLKRVRPQDAIDGRSRVDIDEYSNSMKKSNKKKKDVVKKMKTGRLGSFDLVKMKRYLALQGTFPADFRGVIWKSLLKVPENKSQFSHLLTHGFDFELKDFSLVYDTKNKVVLRRIKKLISLLGNISTVYTVASFIPQMIYPIERLFQADSIVIFEVLLTWFSNWGKDWFIYYPNPPFKLLKHVEDILQRSDEELYEHMKLRCGSKLYCWYVVKNLFTENFLHDDWYKVFDHVFSQPLLFFYCVNVSFLIEYRERLMGYSLKSQFQAFFESPAPPNVKKRRVVDIDGILSRAMYLLKVEKKTWAQRKSVVLNDEFRYLLSSPMGLPRGKNYPLFIKEGEFLQVDKRCVNERRKQIEEEEKELYLRKRVQMKTIREVERRVKERELTQRLSFIREQKQALDEEEQNMRIPTIIPQNRQQQQQQQSEDDDEDEGEEVDVKASGPQTLVEVGEEVDEFAESMRMKLVEQERKIRELEEASMNKSREFEEKMQSNRDFEDQLKKQLRLKEEEVEDMKKMLFRTSMESERIEGEKKLLEVKSKERVKMEKEISNLQDSLGQMSPKRNSKLYVDSKRGEEDEHLVIPKVDGMNFTFETPVVRRSVPKKSKPTTEAKRSKMKKKGKTKDMSKEAIQQRFSQFLMKRSGLGDLSHYSSSPRTSSSLILSSNFKDSTEDILNNSHLSPMSNTPRSDAVSESDISTVDIDVNVTLSPTETYGSKSSVDTDELENELLQISIK